MCYIKLLIIQLQNREFVIRFQKAIRHLFYLLLITIELILTIFLYICIHNDKIPTALTAHLRGKV